MQITGIGVDVGGGVGDGAGVDVGGGVGGGVGDVNGVSTGVGEAVLAVAKLGATAVGETLLGVGAEVAPEQAATDMITMQTKPRDRTLT